MGYKVDWKPDHKYMTYTTPDGIRCRDSKLFDETLSRDSLETYYKLGGVKYLSAVQEASHTKDEPTPMLRDVLVGMSTVSVALAGMLSDDEKQDEDFFRQLYYAELSVNNIVELIHILQQYRTISLAPQFDYTSPAKQKQVVEDSEDEIEEEISDEEYAEEYAINHGYDDDDEYEEYEQGWGMSM